MPWGFAVYGLMWILSEERSDWLAQMQEEEARAATQR
jgi:hypothetical protein